MSTRFVLKCVYVCDSFVLQYSMNGAESIKKFIKPLT